jgi:hypothetical protein
VADHAVRGRPSAQAWAAPGGNRWRVLGRDDVRWAVAGADRPLLVRRMATVTMGDIGEEITEIELEPLPEEMPAEPVTQPATEPVPG